MPMMLMMMIRSDVPPNVMIPIMMMTDQMGGEYENQLMMMMMMMQVMDMRTPSTPATPAPCPCVSPTSFNFIVRDATSSDVVVGAKVSIEHLDGGFGFNFDAEASTEDNGTATINIERFGPEYKYNVTVSAPGFIDSVFPMSGECNGGLCSAARSVALSPWLPPGHTRLILSWDTALPEDMDMHIMGVNKVNGSLCRAPFLTDPGQTTCPEFVWDHDNTNGGLSGAESVTFTDSLENQLYVYGIGISDYMFGMGTMNNGTDFLQCGATLTITNGVDTEVTRLEAHSISVDAP